MHRQLVSSRIEDVITDAVLLSVKEANLLRKRLRHMLQLRSRFLQDPGAETVHDLRVASRRVREVLDYFQNSIPQEWFEKLSRLAKRITRSLGSLREVDVNLAMIQDLRKENAIHPLSAELMIHLLNGQKNLLHEAALQSIRTKKFGKYDKFLSLLKGSRNANPSSDDVLCRRREDFWSFPIETEMDDELLHDLRIRTKRFRYAVEIYDHIHRRNLGRFLNTIRNLQETLGRIHDLFVFALKLDQEAQSWSDPQLTLIPTSLQELLAELITRKVKLYSRVRPLYERVIESAPEEILAAAPKKFQQISTAMEPAPVAVSAPQR